jgi:LysM repeat protein
MGKQVTVKYYPHKEKSRSFSTRFNVVFLLVNIVFFGLNIFCFNDRKSKSNPDGVEVASVLVAGDTAVIVPDSMANLLEADSVAGSMPSGEIIDTHFVMHIVADGQTLYTLSRKYHVPVDSIRKFNKLGSNTIILGESLKIPQPK